MFEGLMLDWPNTEKYSQITKLIRKQRADIEKQIRNLKLNQPVLLQPTNGYWNGKNIILFPTLISNDIKSDLIKAAPDKVSLGEVLFQLDTKDYNDFGVAGYDYIETEELYIPKAKEFEKIQMGEDIEPIYKIYIPYISSRIITCPYQIYDEAKKFMTHCKQKEFEKLETILGFRKKQISKAA